MALPSYNPNLSSPVGSGNPYWGSGFTNFDRFLQDPNIQWGSEQTDYVPQSDNWDEGNVVSNWLINASGTAGFPKPTTPDDGRNIPPIYTYPGPYTQPQTPAETPKDDWTQLDAHVDRAHENNPWRDPTTGTWYGLGRQRYGEEDSGAGAGYRDW